MSDARRGPGSLRAIPRPTGPGALVWNRDGFRWAHGSPGHVLTVQTDGTHRFAPSGSGGGSYDPAGTAAAAVAAHVAEANPHTQYDLVGGTITAPPSLSGTDINDGAGSETISAITTPWPGYRFGATSDGIYAWGLGAVGANCTITARFRSLASRNGYCSGNIALWDGSDVWVAGFRVSPDYMSTALALAKVDTSNADLFAAAELAHFGVWEQPHWLQLVHASGGGGSLTLKWSHDGVNWSTETCVQTTSVGTPSHAGVAARLVTGGSRSYRWIVDSYAAT